MMVNRHGIDLEIFWGLTVAEMICIIVKRNGYYQQTRFRLHLL
jgi:hypothetical protein